MEVTCCGTDGEFGRDGKLHVLPVGYLTDDKERAGCSCSFAEDGDMVRPDCGDNAGKSKKDAHEEHEGCRASKIGMKIDSVVVGRAADLNCCCSIVVDSHLGVTACANARSHVHR